MVVEPGGITGNWPVPESASPVGNVCQNSHIFKTRLLKPVKNVLKSNLSQEIEKEKKTFHEPKFHLVTDNLMKYNAQYVNKTSSLYTSLYYVNLQLQVHTFTYTHTHTHTLSKVFNSF
jgi:hypothetical protein